MKAFEDFWRLYLAQQFGTTDGAEEETVEKATARAIWLAARPRLRPISSVPMGEPVLLVKYSPGDDAIFWVASGEIDPESGAMFIDVIDQELPQVAFQEPSHWMPFEDAELIGRLTGRKEV